jgi:hypothetical protein
VHPAPRRIAVCRGAPPLEDDVAGAPGRSLVSRTLNLTDELLHAAARAIEAVMFEPRDRRLRAALPELVAAALREQLAPDQE